jgi:hypothetical protein
MTPEKYEHFIEEVKKLCEAHGIGMVGTCWSEGILGEITLFDMTDPEASDWRSPEDGAFNFEYKGQPE